MFHFVSRREEGGERSVLLLSPNSMHCSLDVLWERRYLQSDSHHDTMLSSPTLAHLDKNLGKIFKSNDGAIEKAVCWLPKR